MLFLLGTALLLAPAGWAAGGQGDGGAVVSGVVRDARGVVQMGALVQVLAANSVTVATAFTDDHGRYTIANLLPGKYQVRASSTLFVPTTKSNLQLMAGARAVIDLTLSALFDSASWLPSGRRRGGADADDWEWTLRSSANRPILRILPEHQGDVVVVTAQDGAGGRESRISIQEAGVAGSGGFGRGGAADVVTLRTGPASGLRQGLTGEARTEVSAAGAVEVSAGTERAGFGGASRTVAEVSAHPEITGPGGQGVEVMTLRTGQQTALGENVALAVGGSVEGVRDGAYALAARPFLRVSVNPGGGWRVQYSLATSADAQGFGDLAVDRGEAVPVAVPVNGKLTLERGTHQELSLSRRAGRSVVEVAYYHDGVVQAGVAGTGSAAAMLDENAALGAGATGLLADSAAGEFRTLGGGYTTDGARFTVSAPVSQELWLAAEYVTGDALVSESGARASLVEALGGLRAVNSQAAGVALEGKLAHSGTRVRASYRWQQTATVTAVDPFGPMGDSAYLSCLLQQRVRLGHWMPAGFSATIDVSNLLAQGYRPFLSADGQTLYFAQAPRAAQAGLSFTF